MAPAKRLTTATPHTGFIRPALRRLLLGFELGFQRSELRKGRIGVRLLVTGLGVLVALAALFTEARLVPITARAAVFIARRATVIARRAVPVSLTLIATVAVLRPVLAAMLGSALDRPRRLSIGTITLLPALVVPLWTRLARLRGWRCLA